VAEAGQVLEGQDRAALVVDIHTRHASPIEPVTDADDVTLAIRDVVERRVAAVDVAHDQDPVGVGLLEHRAVDRGDVGPVVHVTEEEAVIAGPCRRVDTAQDLDVVRVRDVAGDDAEQRAPAAAKGAGEQVRAVAELRRGGDDPLARRLSNRNARFAAIEDPRHGRDRDAGLLRNVAKGDHVAGWSHRRVPSCTRLWWVLTPATMVPT
jgi:hypothetical protein